MTKRQRQQFMKWVAEELVEIYSISLESVIEMVRKSPVEQLLKEMPEWMDHWGVPSTANDVWEFSMQ